MSLPALTLGTAAAAVVGSVGVAALVNGIRHAFVDDTAIGAVLLLVAWGILETGALL